VEQPDLAREIGLGRPDLPGAHAMDVVDVNHAPVEALAELPGIDAELAGRLVAAREEVKGFVSVEDAGVVLDLDTTTVDRLSRQAVFLPF
jgi:DNA uptake protein ComE-like DNA-binding protein